MNSSRETIGMRSLKHGASVGGKCTTEYATWSSMRARCNNPKNKRWERYGGRGISICSRWDDFENFLADMGNRPKGTTLDRIDNNGNYEPSNCRWATFTEQMRNRGNTIRLTHEGVTLSAPEWAEKTGLPVKTIYCRVDYGWPDKDVLTVPYGKRLKTPTWLKINCPEYVQPIISPRKECQRGHLLEGDGVHIRTNKQGRIRRECVACTKIRRKTRWIKKQQ